MEKETLKEKCILLQKYMGIVIKSYFQYKVDAILKPFTVFMREATSIIVIFLTLRSFKTINGWSELEIFFLFSILFLTYSLFILVFTGLRDFEILIYEGTFDRFLLRPRGVLFQVLVCNADYFAAIGHGSLGVVLFVLSAKAIGVSWNIMTVVYYIIIIISGVFIQGGVFLILACFSFYFIKIASMQDLFYYNARKFAGYPISIFPGLIQKLLIYIVPFAFVNYFPSQFLLRKSDMASYPQLYMYLTPLVGVIFFGMGRVFWKYSIKHYESTGT